MALLAIEGLSVGFAREGRFARVIPELTYSVEAGETLGIVGESGSGKSVHALALLGLLPQPPGRILGGRAVFDGHDLLAMPEARLRDLRGGRIGMIFQDPMTALNPLLTIGQQLVETIRTHLPLSESEAVARAVSLLEETGISGAAQRLAQYPHQFSGGMRQRVVIALALAAGPRLLIADEPTTALDVSVQAQVIALLKQLCRDRGMAVMLVTHDMGVIAEACDRVAVMYAGRIVEIGPVRDVIHSPAHPYAIGLMGAIPSMSGERERLLQIDGAMPRLGEIPEGCAFHLRCPQAWARCRSERPELMPVGASRAACWLHDAGEPR